MSVPEDAVTRAAALVVVLPLLRLSEVLGRPGRPALLEVSGELHDAEPLLAVGADGPRVGLFNYLDSSWKIIIKLLRLSQFP